MTAELSAVELAAGVVFGAQRRPPALEGENATERPREALERTLRCALQRAPCLVSFSGGRDSSAVLALATAVARREGLPDPVPTTHRVAGAPGADESDWQERVVRHLGLGDWVRLEWRDELDLVGPVATGALRRHGLLWPFNAHFHAPLLAVAGRGSLLTGIGGDELFGCAFPSREADVLARRVRPEPRDIGRLALAVAPHPVRRAVRARRHPLPLPWLTPRGRRTVGSALNDFRSRQPHRVLPRMRWCRTMRYLEIGIDSLGRLADEQGVSIAHPLANPRLWAAVAREAGPAGFADRTSGMRALFSGLLPDDVLARRGKAHFNEVFFGPYARRFAEAWDGEGLPAELIDADRLREHWLAPRPLAQSFLLLQAAWLSASDGGGLDEPLGGPGQPLPALRAA